MFLHLNVTLSFVLISSKAWSKDKPNILVIFTDDVGISNVGAYHRGLMSSQTPNVDSIARWTSSPAWLPWYADRASTSRGFMACLLPTASIEG